MSTWNGLKIIQSPHALAPKTTSTVTLISPNKRRNRYRVQVTTKMVPTTYMLGDTMYMHPDLYRALRQSDL